MTQGTTPYGEPVTPYRRLPVPPGICGWQGCRNQSSLRYSVDLCGDHAEFIADRVDYINQKRRSPSNGEKLKLRNDWLEAKVKQLQARLDESRAEKAQRRAAATDGTIYYVELGGVIKVGWTTDLGKRLKAYGPAGTLLAVEPGTRKDEARIHKALAAYRSHGSEWYAPTPSVKHHIEMVIEKHGEPPTLDVGAKPVPIQQPRAKQYTQTRARSGGRVRHRA